MTPTSLFTFTYSTAMKEDHSPMFKTFTTTLIASVKMLLRNRTLLVSSLGLAVISIFISVGSLVAPGMSSSLWVSLIPIHHHCHLV